MEANGTECGRMEANGVQRRLPLEAVIESDGAYWSDVQDVVQGKTERALLKWMLDAGNRQSGCKVCRRRTIAELATVTGFAQSSVCVALTKLKKSGLVIQSDGEIRLRLSWLVELAELAREKRSNEPRPDPEAALAALGGIRRHSAPFGAPPVSVERESTYPEFVDPFPIPNGTGRSAAAECKRMRPNVGEPLPDARTPSPNDGILKLSPAWRALQSHHFRPRLDVKALQRAYYAACNVETLDGKGKLLRDKDSADGAKCLEDRKRFLTAAYDLANSTVDKPAACLRVRTERRALYRGSDEGRRWADTVIRPAEYRNASRGETVRDGTGAKVCVVEG